VKAAEPIRPLVADDAVDADLVMRGPPQAAHACSPARQAASVRLAPRRNCGQGRAGPTWPRAPRLPHGSVTCLRWTRRVRSRIDDPGVFGGDAFGERECALAWGMAGAPAMAACALASESQHHTPICLWSPAFARCTSTSPGTASLTAAGRAACLVTISQEPSGPAVNRSSLKTAIATLPAGPCLVLLARYEQPPGLGVTRRCPRGWNLLKTRRHESAARGLVSKLAAQPREGEVLLVWVWIL
jgi:hypothetical protein